MIAKEAFWIRQHVIDKYRPQSILNCGSSTYKFRSEDQPFIENVLFLNLQHVTHLDAKMAPGVNIVADVAHKDFNMYKTYQLVLLTSVLEHVEEIGIVMDNMRKVCGRHLVVSVPTAWPYHPDPIDTMYRPSLEELEHLCRVHNFQPIDSVLLSYKRGRLVSIVCAEIQDDYAIHQSPSGAES